jgi:hypothetical protein
MGSIMGVNDDDSERRGDSPFMKETIGHNRPGKTTLTNLSQEEQDYLEEHKDICLRCHHIEAFHWKRSEWIGGEDGDEDNVENCIIPVCGCSEFRKKQGA